MLPLLGPATLFLVVWPTINALQLFDEIYVTTKGGPLQATTVVVYYLYQQAFQFFNAGYAAAIAYVLFVGNPGRHGCPARDQPPDGALHARDARCAAPARGTSFLLPLALVMAAPLVWMVLTSLETPGEARQFPPVLSRPASTGRTTPTRSSRRRSAAGS